MTLNWPTCRRSQASAPFTLAISLSSRWGAKQLLKQTSRSIVEVALLCGFSSHSHLSKQFRQATGTTPSAYRASVQ